MRKKPSTTFIISRLDYCNSSLSCVTKPKSRKTTTNTKFCNKTGLFKFDRIIQTFYELHWMLVIQSINFKVLAHVLNSVHGTGLKYLDSFLSYNTQSRNPRSSNSMVLHQHKSRTNFGSRAFATPRLAVWNQLSTEIKLAPSVAIFKRKLKTYLF